MLLINLGQIPRAFMRYSWLMKQNTKSTTLILLVSLLFGCLQISSAAAAAKSSSYKKGWNIVIDTAPEKLFQAGFESNFGATGQPVKSKVDNWCRTLIRAGRARTDAKNMTDFYKGCIDASMTLRLR